MLSLEERNRLFRVKGSGPRLQNENQGISVGSGGHDRGFHCSLPHQPPVSLRDEMSVFGAAEPSSFVTGP